MMVSVAHRRCSSRAAGTYGEWGLMSACCFAHNQRSPAVGDFYGTGIEIWAGFGPVGNTEKKNWAEYEQLLRLVFSCFHGQKKIKNIVVSALESCIK